MGFTSPRPPGHPPPSTSTRCFTEKEGSAPTGISYARKLPGDVTSDYLQQGLRWSTGLQGGWRILAADVGYLRNSALVVSDPARGWLERKESIHGLRVRVGLAFAHELFTGGDTRYSPRCCLPKGTPSETACECERVPVGVSLFFYYANELYFSDAGN
jgi:hypothetical protein